MGIQSEGVRWEKEFADSFLSVWGATGLLHRDVLPEKSALFYAGKIRSPFFVIRDIFWFGSYNKYPNHRNGNHVKDSFRMN